MPSKPKHSSLAVCSAYIAFLTVLALLVYSTLFVRAYPSIARSPADSSQTSQTPDSQTSSGSESTVSSHSGSTSSNHSYTTYPDQGEKIATVLIDPGHGGFDGGNATEDGILEKDINLAISNKVVEDLQKLNPNIEVKTIRSDDNVSWAQTDTDDLNYRVRQQIEQGADYVISLHCNALLEDPSVSGYTFFINPDDPVMRELSEAIKTNLEAVDWSSCFGIIDNEKLQVVSMSDSHSMLIELAFMTNESDLALLTSPQAQDECAMAIAAAISDYIMAHPDIPEYNNPSKDRNHEILGISSASAQTDAASDSALNSQ